MVGKSEFFINMKSIPDKTSREYDAFFEEELHKIEYGFTTNGIYIPGWLYWHTNHWKIYYDVEDKVNGVIKRKFDTPLLRDNEWEFAEVREEAIRRKMGLMVTGTRRYSKSEIEASVIGRSSTIYEGSENVIAAGNDKDLKLIADKIDKGLNGIHPYFRWTRIENDWKKQVTLGIKDKDGARMPFSSILPRNLDDGHNTEAIAGITAKELVIDEGGKFLFLRCLEAAIPAFTSPFGWRCSPLIVCTGGSFEKGQDAEKLHLNPEAYNFLGLEMKEEGKKYSMFIPGTYRMEAKEDCKLGEWLSKEKGVNIPEKSELYNLSFQCKNEEKALSIIHAEREKAKQANDQEAYLKAIMYYPLTPEECFLTASFNMYNTDAARAQKNRLFSEGVTGSYVELYHDGEKIQHKFVDKKPILEYPIKANADKDVPIVIWEMPIKDPPFGLYTAGIDPYRQGQAKFSNSLGVVYIFKRVHNIFDEKAKNEIVACYAARPNEKSKWNEQARLLIKYYNARALCENDEISFIDYMISKGDEQYLEPEPQYLKSRIKNSSVNRKYGIHRSAGEIRNHLDNTLKTYLDTVIKVDKDESGSVIKEYTGVYKIPDPALLDEIIKFNPDDNYDRIIASQLAISLGEYLNSTLGIIDESDGDRRMKSYQNIKKKSLFTNKQSFTTFNKRRLF